MLKEDLEISDGELLEKLDLVVEGKLKRAGVLCFYREPEKISGGCYVKIGKFEGSELLYQDEVHGSLLIMADRVIDLIYLKYLKATISYHKETRVETYRFARDAVREAVFNALIHCNWADNIPVQIRIEDDAMFVSNCSMLPFGWTAETLLGAHVSKPYNPDIARVFYRAGYVESWGRGIQKIRDACKMLGSKEPKYIVHGEDIMVKFSALPMSKETNVTSLNRHDVGLDVGLEKEVISIISQNSQITMAIIAKELNVTKRTIERMVRKLRERGTIERKGGKRYGYWEIHQ